MKSLQKEQNSTNLLLRPPICRNKSAITPKWFNSLDTNSSRSCNIVTETTWTNNCSKLDRRRKWHWKRTNLMYLLHNFCCYVCIQDTLSQTFEVNWLSQQQKNGSKCCLMSSAAHRFSPWTFEYLLLFLL